MVGSVLNSNTIAQLLPLCVACDPDGAMLVKEESAWFEGGFEWRERGISLSEHPGLGPTPKSEKLVL